MVKYLQFFNDAGSTLQARSQHFIDRDLPGAYTPEQDGDTNPKVACDAIFQRCHFSAVLAPIFTPCLAQMLVRWDFFA